MAEKTLENIHDIATKEFLEKGFRGASLREIVKKAGVTTGAFYGYYKSKEELFDALVKEHADYVRNIFDVTVIEFKKIPLEQWSEVMNAYSDRGMTQMFEYAWEHKNAFKLILQASEGTVWENYIHDIVEVEIELTHTFYKVIESQGYKPHRLDGALEHIIISGQFTSMFEMIVHDIPKEKGLSFVKELHAFYEAGWNSLLNRK
ncbi:MAG: TetR/AcrR family transcriptional regulator [Treponema sp.]|nr:TetR/AcrR family transcriptional regulator [Treponema sp.]